MTEDLLEKYEKMLSEFDLDDEFQRGEHAGLVQFLNSEDITENKLAELVENYWNGLNGNVSALDFVQDPTYHWVGYVAAFERKRTIKGNREESVAIIRASRRAIAKAHLKESSPKLYEEIYGENGSDEKA